VVIADASRDIDAVDAAQMARALLIAERGRGRTSPNPMVGAVVVDDEGVVVGRGTHEVAGGPHAEVHALDEAGTRARGATLYCTLEPCSHVGRTGPCAHRVVQAGIRRAVVAVEDPNPLVRGRGLEYLRAHGVTVTLGIRRDEAERLNRPFFTLMRAGRPFITMKAAVSLDGRVAAVRGVRTALTGPLANTLVHRERAEVDAIAVGSETVLVDDPLLTARGVYRHRPLVRVILDRRLRTPATAKIFTTLEHGPVIVFGMRSDGRAPDRPGRPGEKDVEEDASARADRLTAAGARIELIDGADTSSEAFLEAAVARLGGLGITSLIVEGGPTVHAAFWRAGLIDRVELFLTPQTIGAGGVEWIPLRAGDIASLDDLTAQTVGEDVLIEGYVHRPH
jgi:diaminohydroxyphosphoribosylaminopyrimidine deaminase / 5-amino-6-(5-phosphoribosylamino)uracil reductase